MSWLKTLSFWMAAFVVLAAPWLFGAWEIWWFWPFVTVLFAASALLAALLFKSGELTEGLSRVAWWRYGVPAVAGYGAFLAYALVRLFQTRVYMDAERSVLLFLTAFLVGLIIVFTGHSRRNRLLHGLLLADFLALGLYGIVNHAVTGSALVLWRPGFEQYMSEHRATGTYFCPDHFAGAMELGFALALGLLAARRVSWAGRVLALAVLAVSVVGVVLSKSRGGGLTLAVVLGVAVVAGFAQWRPAVRWMLRAGLVLAAALAVVVFVRAGGSYVQRFRNYPWAQIEHWDRYQMASGALRAWQTAPVLGIGPGMHRNLWPRFAATPDGDRERGIWPSRSNLHFHSYEVHSDWVQLLEEYGSVGLVLFLVAVLGVMGPLLAAWRAEARAWARPGGPADGADPAYPAVLGALLGAAAMAFHSLGDFNLQMPATTWLLAAMVALALGRVLRNRHGHGHRAAGGRQPPPSGDEG